MPDKSSGVSAAVDRGAVDKPSVQTGSFRALINTRFFWLVITLVVCLALVLNSLVAYQSIKVYSDTAERLTYTQRLLAGVRALYVSIVNAETGERGFLLTLDPEYLVPYQESFRAQRGAAEELAGLPSFLVGQNQEIKRLGNLIGDKRRELNRTIALARNGQLEEALDLIRSNRGNQIMEEIRHSLHSIEARELAATHRLQAELRTNNQRAIVTQSFSLAFGLSLMLVVGFLLRRKQTDTREHLESLEDANARLEQRVEARTAEIAGFTLELERSNRELQDFAYVASHDLQEPLRKIRAFGDRLQVKYAEQLDGKGSDYIKRMQAAAARMAALIEALLSYSRIATTKESLATVSLQTILEEVLEDLDIRIREQEAVVQADALPEVHAVAIQIRQILQNLIGNALKFVEEGKTPLIRIWAERQFLEKPAALGDSVAEAGYVEEGPAENADTLQLPKAHFLLLFVRDNGIGIDDAFSERIFAPFQRLHHRGVYEGTGIGLAICRRIAERHGGFIRVEASPGGGSTFVVGFPDEIENPDGAKADVTLQSGAVIDLATQCNNDNSSGD